jgi:hypothetical protein
MKSPTAASVGVKFTAMRRAVRALLDARLGTSAIWNQRRVQYAFINVSIDSVILMVDKLL